MRPSGPERAALIGDVIEKHRPDLLLCAGYAVETPADLTALQNRLRNTDWAGSAVVEVAVDTELKKFHPAACLMKKKNNQKGSHRLWLVTREGVKSLGPQIFVRSDQLTKNKCSICEIFKGYIEEKTGQVGDARLVVLCCGELNAVRLDRTNRTIEPISREIAEWLDGADLIVNPTHDRMGNGGILKAKRELLSQSRNGRSRLYISASNWNTDKKVGKNGKAIRQSRNAKTLHTVYLDGKWQEQATLSNAKDKYMYRETIVQVNW